MQCLVKAASIYPHVENTHHHTSMWRGNYAGRGDCLEGDAGGELCGWGIMRGGNCVEGGLCGGGIVWRVNYAGGGELCGGGIDDSYIIP